MAVYYVDQSHASANDNNSGTEISPWLTIQRAANAAKAGDTIYVKAGVYKPFKVVSSGTEDNHITFAAYPGDEHEAIIDGTGTSVRGLIESRGHSHLTIAGFRLQDAPTDGIFIEGSKAGARDILITGNQVDGTDNAGIYAAGLIMGQTIPVNEYRLFDLTIENNEITRTNITGGNECISVGGGLDGFVIRNNWVHDSQQYGIDAKMGAKNGEISDNLIHGIEKHGIYLDSNSRTIEDVSIHNNTIFNNTNGIVLAREASRDPAQPNIDDVKIYDNLVYDNAKYGIMAYKHIRDTETGAFSDVSITSNTVHGNGINGIRLVDIGDFATGFTVSGNSVYDNKTNIFNTIGAKESTNLLKDPGSIAPGDGVRPGPGYGDGPGEEPVYYEAHYDVGGPGWTTGDDIVFASGPDVASGQMTVRTKAFAIAGTEDDAIYNSYGFGDRFGFAIEVPEDGDYRVELHLAEIWHTSAGNRVFDVALEGQVKEAFDDIDLVALTGKRYAATTITEHVTVTDGVLNIEAIATVDNALINGFSLYYDTLAL